MFKQFLENNRELGESVLYAVLLLFSSMMIYESYNYGQDARLVPLITLVILALLVLIKLIINVSQRYSFGISSYFESNAGFSVPEEIADKEPLEKGSSSITKSDPDPVREIRAIGWTSIFAGVFFLFGIINPIFIVFFIFLFIEHDGSNIRSAATALMFFIIIYLLFVEVLNMRIYSGVIPTGLL